MRITPFLLVPILLLVGLDVKGQCSASAGADYFINTTVIWDNTTPPPSTLFTGGLCNRNIIVQAGGTLRMNGITMRFNKHGKIEVQRCGKLIIENICHLYSGCPENTPGNGSNEGLWRGISVQGDIAQPQTNSSAHGQVFILGYNIIEDGYCGVRSKNGGILLADGATFEDCYRTFLFEDYPNYSLASRIDYCEVTVGDDITSDNGLPDYGLKVYKCPFNGIKVLGGLFANFQTNNYSDYRRGKGIYFKASGGVVNGSSYANADITGWHEGINISNTPSLIPSFSGDPQVIIKDFDFNDNKFAIGIYDNDDVLIEENNFKHSLQTVQHTGLYDIYTDDSYGTHIMKNDFSWEPNMNYINIRSIKFKDGSAYIYENTFTDKPTTGTRSSFRAIMTENYFRWLEWSCNDFDIEHSQLSNSYDVYIHENNTGSVLPSQGSSSRPTYNLYNSSPTNLNNTRVWAVPTVNFKYYSDITLPRHLQQSNTVPNVTVLPASGEALCYPTYH